MSRNRNNDRRNDRDGRRGDDYNDCDKNRNCNRRRDCDGRGDFDGNELNDSCRPCWRNGPGIIQPQPQDALVLLSPRERLHLADFAVLMQTQPPNVWNSIEPWRRWDPVVHNDVIDLVEAERRDCLLAKRNCTRRNLYDTTHRRDILEEDDHLDFINQRPFFDGIVNPLNTSYGINTLNPLNTLNTLNTLNNVNTLSNIYSDDINSLNQTSRRIGFVEASARAPAEARLLRSHAYNSVV